MQKGNQSGRGRGGRNDGYRRGPGGFCVCPACGEKKEHERGNPCPDESCPKCGARMVRE